MVKKGLGGGGVVLESSVLKYFQFQVFIRNNSYGIVNSWCVRVSQLELNYYSSGQLPDISGFLDVWPYWGVLFTLFHSQDEKFYLKLTLHDFYKSLGVSFVTASCDVNKRKLITLPFPSFWRLEVTSED